jgi:hypothetical protein
MVVVRIRSQRFMEFLQLRLTLELAFASIFHVREGLQCSTKVRVLKALLELGFLIILENDVTNYSWSD